MKTLLIAHRGDTAHYAENTLKSFQSAFQQGADGIELDIQLFQDKLIVVHDYQFDTTARYPTLDDVLAKIAHLGRIEIEVKGFTHDLIEPLVLALSKHPKLDYEITSSVFFLIPEIRRQLPKASIGLIFQPSEFEDWMTEKFILRKITETTKTLKANVAHLPAALITKELVRVLHSSGIKVHTHLSASDSVSRYLEFSNLGVDQCTFDDIALLEKLS